MHLHTHTLTQKKVAVAAAAAAALLFSQRIFYYLLDYRHSRELKTEIKIFDMFSVIEICAL